MRVPVGLKLSVFSLAVMGVYTYFANSIPQIESKPPEELSLEGGNVTPAQLVKAGEQIFHTKGTRSEEHTSELQSRLHLVCRLLLEKKKSNTFNTASSTTRRSK